MISIFSLCKSKRNSKELAYTCHGWYMFHIVIIRILRKILKFWKIYVPLFVAITFFLMLVVLVFLNVEEKLKKKTLLTHQIMWVLYQGCFVFSVCFRLWPDLDVCSPSYSPYTVLSLNGGTDEKNMILLKCTINSYGVSSPLC